MNNLLTGWLCTICLLIGIFFGRTFQEKEKSQNIDRIEMLEIHKDGTYESNVYIRYQGISEEEFGVYQKPIKGNMIKVTTDGDSGKQVFLAYRD